MKMHAFVGVFVIFCCTSCVVKDENYHHSRDHVIVEPEVEAVDHVHRPHEYVESEVEIR